MAGVVMSRIRISDLVGLLVTPNSSKVIAGIAIFGSIEATSVDSNIAIFTIYILSVEFSSSRPRPPVRSPAGLPPEYHFPRGIPGLYISPDRKNLDSPSRPLDRRGLLSLLPLLQPL